MDPHAPPSLLSSVHRLFADERRRQASDRDLLQAFVQRRENDAFAELLRRHGPMVLRVALHLLHHRQDAEDVFQAAFLTLARKAHSLRKESSVAAWLHRVAWRLAVRSRAAAKRRNQPLPSLPDSEQHSPADEISLRESQGILHQELAALPEQLRLPLVLCYLQGRTRDEAAQRLGWSLGTLKRRLEQGRKLLHARLSRRGVTLPAVLAATLLAAAEVPASLAASTLRLATSSLIGSASVPASVAALMAKASWSVKVKTVLGLALMLSACAGTWVYCGQRGEPAAPLEKAQTPGSPPAAARKNETPHPPRDLYGDALPAGALARLGTVRLRHGDYLTHSSIRFAPNGKTLISLGSDGVRVWDTATGKPVRQFGAGVSPRSMALSCDGRRIALSREHAGTGGPVEVWDAATGKLLHQMGHRHYSRVCLSPDGKQLAALAADFSPSDTRSLPWNIDLWDVETGRDIRTLTGPKEYIADMIFSADGKSLLLGGSGKAISVRSTADGKEVRRFHDLAVDVYSLVLSPRGDRIAYIELWLQKRTPRGGGSWGAGVGVHLLDAATGAELRRWSLKPKFGWNEVLENGWWNLAFSPDGRRLAACRRDGPVRIWDTASGEEQRLAPDGRNQFGGVAFSPDGKTLAVGESGRLIHLIDAQTRAGRLPVGGHRGCVTGVALSRDGGTAFTASEEGIIHRWNALTGLERGRLADLKSRVRGLLLSPDGRTLFLRSNDDSLRAWDVDSNAQRWCQNSTGDYMARSALSADGEILAAVGPSDTLKLFKASTGELLHDLTSKTPIWDMAFASDASTVFALTGRWTVRRWDTAGGRPLPDLTLPVDAAEQYHGANVVGAGESAVLSPDGRLAAYGYAYGDRFLRLFDVLGQREIYRFGHLPGEVAAMAFAPDGRSFAWAERTGVIHWLELAGGGERRTMPGHAGAVWQLVFSSDGKRLVSGSYDTTVLVWDLIGQGSAKLSAGQRDACWIDLADKDAAKAYRALYRLIAAPADALALLHPHLKPIEGVDEKRIERLVDYLDSDKFAVREKATKELHKLGELAEPALRKMMASRPGLEMRRRLQGLLDDIGQHQWHPAPELLRQLRAIEVLERIATPEARRLLETIAGGAAGARQSREACAAVRRLASPHGVKP